MVRMDMFQLRKAIPSEEFDYALLTSVLRDYSAIRQKINELLKSKVITRVKKGLYVFGPEYNRAPVRKETLANLIYGPSCISLEYALAFHGLIPERVETITSVTSKRDKQFETPLGMFTYRYLASEKYSLGIEQIWVDKTHPVLMASAEKALCDLVTLNKIPPLSSLKETREFLEDDLRIDREHWKRFDLRSLRHLAKHYRSQNIERIMDVLDQERGNP